MDSSQDVVWNAYIDKYNVEPSNATQLRVFSNNTENNTTKLSFTVAKTVWNRNKGKWKIEAQSSTLTTASDAKSSEKSSVIISATQNKLDPKDELQLSEMMKVQMDRMKSKEIDAILNEIDENEAKVVQENISSDVTDKEEVDPCLNNIVDRGLWRKITREIGKGNLRFIKAIITSNDINVNAQNPKDNNKTLLIYATIIGNKELVNLLCNFGADVAIKDDDGYDALEYAIKYGQYEITELLYYRQLSGSLGTDMKRIAQQIRDKDKAAAFVMEFKYECNWEEVKIHEGIIQYMIHVMQKQLMFGEDMLYYAWYCVTHDAQIQNPLKSKLFTSMVAAYEKIIANTTDKDGWYWLKSHFLKSYIWYLPHPIYSKTNNESEAAVDDDSGDNQEKVLKQTLFWELLTRIRAESKKQSDILLTSKIDAIRLQTPQQWNTLIAYNVHTEYSKDARQDSMGAIIPRYNAEDLSPDLYPPSTHFDAKIHYDTNIYLNEVLFQGNILDAIFQKDMKLITKQIQQETGISVSYRAGPVKTLKRAKAKVENHYSGEKYPTSAKILDINRCAVQFEEIPHMMQYIKVLTEMIEAQHARSIMHIIRCKNGWTVYNPTYPQYTDIKLNVLVQDPMDKNKQIIAEIQLLLSLMSDFKKKAHKLYSVERKYELVYNFGQLRQELEKFSDHSGQSGVMNNLAKNDEIKYFKIMWDTMKNSFDDLINPEEKDVWQNPLLHIILRDGEIHQYIKKRNSFAYKHTLLRWIRRYPKCNNDYDELFKSIASAETRDMNTDDIFAKILRAILECIDGDEYRFKSLLNWRTFLVDLLCSEYNLVKCFQLILNAKVMTEKDRLNTIGLQKSDKHTSFTRAFFRATRADSVRHIFHGYKYISRDKHYFKRVLMNKNYGLYEVLEKKDPVLGKILDIVFNNAMFNRQDMIDIFTKEYDIDDNTGRGSTVLMPAMKGYHGSIAKIFRYFDPKKTKTEMIKQWFSRYILIDKYGRIAPDDTVVEFVRYFRDDSTFIRKCLLEMDEDCKKTAILCMFKDSRFSGKSKVYLQSKIFNDLPFRLRHVLNYKNIEFISGDGEVSSSTEQLIKYYQYDKTMLMKILNARDSEGKTVWMCLWKTACRRSLLILLNGVLDVTDFYTLCHVQDNNGKTALRYLFDRRTYDEIEELPFAQLMLKKFANHKWLLHKLLLQEQESKKLCISFCNQICMYTICDIMDSNRIMNKLLLSVKEWDSMEREAERIIEYFQFDRLDFTDSKYHDGGRADSKDETRMIGIDFYDWDNNPLLIACKMRRYDTVKRYLTQYIKDNKKLFKELLTEFHGYSPSVSIVGQACDPEFNNNNIKDFELLKLIVVENPLLTDHEKFEILAYKDDDETFFMTSTPFCRLKLLQYFGNDRKLIFKILNEQNVAKKNKVTKKVYGMVDQAVIEALDIELDDRIAFNFIMLESPMKCDVEQSKNVLRFVLNCKPLRYSTKIQWLLYEYTVEKRIELEMDFDDYYFKENSVRMTCEFGYSSIIWDFIKHDRKTLLKLLNPANIEQYFEQKTPLMLIARSKYDDNEALRILLEDSALTKDDLALLMRAMDDNKYTVLHHALMNKHTIKPLQCLLKHLKNNAQLLSDLLFVRLHNGNTALSKLIIGLEEKKSWKWHNDFVHDMNIPQKIKAIFETIDDDEILSKLVNTKNDKFQRLFDIQENMIIGDWSSRKDDVTGNIYVIRQLISECMDYVSLSKKLSLHEEHSVHIDTIFDGNSEYSTNPFLSACKFGKIVTIKKLLSYAMNDKKKSDAYVLKKLLLNNYDAMTGDNCLMVLYKNGYTKYIVDIVDLLDDCGVTDVCISLLKAQNPYNGRTVFIEICKNEKDATFIGDILDCIEDNQTVIELLNINDFKDNSCSDYANDEMMVKLQQYLQN